MRARSCHGGIAIMCVKAAEVALDACAVGGTAHGVERASDGIVAMCECPPPTSRARVGAPGGALRMWRGGRVQVGSSQCAPHIGLVSDQRPWAVLARIMTPVLARACARAADLLKQAMRRARWRTV